MQVEPQQPRFEPEQPDILGIYDHNYHENSVSYTLNHQHYQNDVFEYRFNFP